MQTHSFAPLLSSIIVDKLALAFDTDFKRFMSNCECSESLPPCLHWCGWPQKIDSSYPEPPKPEESESDPIERPQTNLDSCSFEDFLLNLGKPSQPGLTHPAQEAAWK